MRPGGRFTGGEHFRDGIGVAFRIMFLVFFLETARVFAGVARATAMRGWRWLGGHNLEKASRVTFESARLAGKTTLAESALRERPETKALTLIEIEFDTGEKYQPTSARLANNKSRQESMLVDRTPWKETELLHPDRRRRIRMSSSSKSASSKEQDSPRPEMLIEIKRQGEQGATTNRKQMAKKY